jgi:hypothetical protein
LRSNEPFRTPVPICVQFVAHCSSFRAAMGHGDVLCAGYGCMSRSPISGGCATRNRRDCRCWSADIQSPRRRDLATVIDPVIHSVAFRFRNFNSALVRSRKADCVTFPFCLVCRRCATVAPECNGNGLVSCPHRRIAARDYGILVGHLVAA